MSRTQYIIAGASPDLLGPGALNPLASDVSFIINSDMDVIATGEDATAWKDQISGNYLERYRTDNERLKWVVGVNAHKMVVLMPWESSTWRNSVLHANILIKKNL